jgi:serine/threonine protein kinase
MRWLCAKAQISRQGGRCPFTPLSPHIIKLLGRFPDGGLVFEKLYPRYSALGRFCSIAIYKQWILHIIAALKVLHSLGIVYPDLRIENLQLSTEGQTLVLADLESRWGQLSAPEIVLEHRLASNWTGKSGIYDIGVVIKCIIYANVSRTSEVEWPVTPPPFDRIVAHVCVQTLQSDRS